MPNTTDLDELMNTALAAVFLGMSKGTVEQWRYLGRGPKFVRLGNGKRAAIRYRKSDLIEWINGNVHQSTSSYHVDKSGKLTRPSSSSSAENSGTPSQSAGVALSLSPITPASPDKGV